MTCVYAGAVLTVPQGPAALAGCAAAIAMRGARLATRMGTARRTRVLRTVDLRRSCRESAGCNPISDPGCGRRPGCEVAWNVALTSRRLPMPARLPLTGMSQQRNLRNRVAAVAE